MRHTHSQQDLIRSRRFVPNFTAAAIALAAAIGCAPAMAQGNSDKTEAFAPGRILVMPRAGLPDGALAAILKENGGGKARRVGQSELRIVDLPPGLEKQSVEKLARHPHIKFAEVDMLVAPDFVSNDPYLGSQWHIGKIGATTAWDATSGSGVTIAVLDTGVDSSHPDLAGSIVPGWNFYSNSSDTSDVYNHGTGVAGSAAAIFNNGMGVAGIAGKARIMPIKISADSGQASWSAVANGITYAADKGARVANISFSAYASSSVQTAAKYMKDKGGLVFVSAGNTGAQSTATATTSLIVISATDSADNIASWSTYGNVVALSAPGTGIYTTTKGGGYVSENGTSFASPVAAGVAALVFAAKPALTAYEVEAILFKSAADFGAAGRDIYFGNGRVDAAKAVSMALSSTSTAPGDSQAPTVAITSPTSGAAVSGIAPINLSASDNVGVTRVELMVNGSVVATDSSAPYGFSWDSTKVGNGTATLMARAYDAAGNVGSSPSVSVAVANTTSTTNARPVVAFNTPAGGTVSGGMVKIVAAASDDGGVLGLKMTLSLNGKQVASSSGTGTVSYNWNTRKVGTGSYTFSAVAVDGNGATGSASVAYTR
jgi:thermitase